MTKKVNSRVPLKNIKNLSISLFLIFSGNIYAQDHSFEIKYDIKGIQSTTASVTIFGNREAVDHEPIHIEDGKFIFTGTAIEPVVARIWLDHDLQLRKTSYGDRGFYPVKSEQIWVIVYPGAKFSVSGEISGKDYMSVNAKDGAENDFFAELAQKMMPLISEIGNLAVEGSNPNISKDKKEENRAETARLSAELEKIKIDFITSRANTLTALWLMEDMLIRSEIKPELLVPILAKVDKIKYSNNYFYKAVSDRISGAFNTSVGQMCPNIETDDTYDGASFSLSSMKGKYVIIDFWGTWCGPCMAGVPHMKEFRDKYQDKIEILGISNDKNVALWRSVIERNNMNWTNILIGTGEKDFVSTFNVQGFPTKILLSPEGKILFRESGENEAFYDNVATKITNCN